MRPCKSRDKHIFPENVKNEEKNCHTVFEQGNTVNAFFSSDITDFCQCGRLLE